MGKRTVFIEFRPFYYLRVSSIPLLRGRTTEGLPRVRVPTRKCRKWKEWMMTTDPNRSSAGLKVAELVKSGEGEQSAIERAPGVWESRGIGNSYLVTTSE